MLIHRCLFLHEPCFQTSSDENKWIKKKKKKPWGLIGQLLFMLTAFLVFLKTVICVRPKTISSTAQDLCQPNSATLPGLAALNALGHSLDLGLFNFDKCVIESLLMYFFPQCWSVKRHFEGLS